LSLLLTCVWLAAACCSAAFPQFKKHKRMARSVKNGATFMRDERI
jgi:hypothetical protein